MSRPEKRISGPSGTGRMSIDDDPVTPRYLEAARTVVDRCGVPRTSEEARAVVEAMVLETRRRGIWSPEGEAGLRSLLRVGERSA
jgi:hypothetical protein